MVVLAACAIYWNSLSAPFIFDDRAAIAENVELRQWPDIVRVLRSAPPETPLSGRPAVSLTFALNYAVSGLDVRGYRLTNVAIHIACGLMLMALVRRTAATLQFGRDRWPSADNVAFAVALLWTVHPLNSEVVSYLSQRTDSAMALCLLLTLYGSMRARESIGSGRWRALAVTAAAVGMACKESMVVAPVLVVLYDRVFVFASLREAFAARGSFYKAIAATWIVLLLVVLSTPRTFAAGFSSLDTSIWHYLLNQSVIITRYLLLVVWPQPLVLFYGWSMPTTLAAVWPYALGIITLVAVSLVAAWRRPALGFLGLWFFIVLAPTSSVAPIAGEVGAERRMYLALAAVIAFGVVGAVWGWRRMTAGLTLEAARARGRVAGVATLAVVTLLLSAGTVVRTRDYASALVMARTIHAGWPSGASAQMLGAELLAAGRHDEAIPYLRESASTYPPGRYALGLSLFETGSYESAIAELRTFIRVEPHLATARHAEMLVADALGRLHRWAEAVDWLKTIISTSPGRMDALGALADAHFQQGDFPAAIITYETFLSFHPGHPEAMANIAIAFASTGRLDEAVTAFRHVVSTQASNGHARLNLARALLDRGRVSDLDEALQMATMGAAAVPRDPSGHTLAGRALELRGDVVAARSAYARALAIDAAYPPALEALARIK